MPFDKNLLAPLKTQEPTHIWYADSLAAEPRHIPVHEFETIIGHRYQYSEAIWVNEEVSSVKDAPIDQEQQALKNKVITLLVRPKIDNFVVRNISNEVGYGIFARKKILPCEIIAVYAGKAGQRKPGKYAIFDKEGHSPNIDSAERGGLMRFMQHLPLPSPKQFAKQVFNLLNNNDLFMLENNKSLLQATLLPQHTKIADLKRKPLSFWESFYINLQEKMKDVDYNPYWHLNLTEFYGDFSEENISCQNVLMEFVEIRGEKIAYFYATREIASGEQLGYDYGPGYWERKILPKFFDHTGHVISTEKYKYNHCSAFQDKYCVIIPRSEVLGLIKDGVTSLACASEENDHELVKFSVYDLRKQFVANNCLPSQYDEITQQNSFSLVLSGIFRKQKIHATISQYYHNPAAENDNKQYDVDVVLKMQTLDHYRSMWVVLTLILRSLMQENKLKIEKSEDTRELIIPSVNVKENFLLLHNMLEKLLNMNLLEEFSALQQKIAEMPQKNMR